MHDGDPPRFLCRSQRLKESSCAPVGVAHGRFVSRAKMLAQDRPLSTPIVVRIFRVTKTFGTGNAHYQRCEYAQSVYRFRCCLVGRRVLWPTGGPRYRYGIRLRGEYEWDVPTPDARPNVCAERST